MSTIYVDGPARLLVGAQNCLATTYVPANISGTGGNASDLGVTESGVQVSVNNLTHRVNSDDCGGSEGNPADFIMMGAMATIRGTLVKYATDAWKTIVAGLYLPAGEEGAVRLPGTAVFANNYGFSLWVCGHSGTIWFPKCELASNPREFNISTTERKTTFTITAHPAGTSSARFLYFHGTQSLNGFEDGCPSVSSIGT